MVPGHRVSLDDVDDVKHRGGPEDHGALFERPVHVKLLSFCGWVVAVPQHEHSGANWPLC